MSEPTAETTWSTANAEYLKAAVRCIRAQLELLAAQRATEISSPATPPSPVEPEPLPIAQPIIVAPPIVEAPRRRRGFWDWFFVTAEPVNPAQPQPSPSPMPVPTPCKPTTASACTQPKSDWHGVEAEARHQLDQLSATAEYASLDVLPALARLRILFGLTPFEENVLRLCIAAELIYSVDSLCARAQDDSRRPYPTLNLALQLFDSAEEDYRSLSSCGALRRWQLIEVIQPSGTPLFAAALRIDERILEYCQGTHSLDQRLVSLGGVVAPHELPPVPASRQVAVDQLADIWADDGSQQSVIHLSGPDTVSKLAVTTHAANVWGRQVYRLHAGQLPTVPAEVDALARIWLRERLLYPLVLFLDADERTTASGEPEVSAQETDRAHAPNAMVTRFLNQVQSGTVIAASESAVRSIRSIITIPIARSTGVEQANLWQQALKFSDKEFPGRLASQFNLDESAILSVAGLVRSLSSNTAEEHTQFKQAWHHCRIRTRPNFDGLAQRIEPADEETELVLANDVRQQLDELEAQVANRWRVYEDWGMRKRLNRGLGISAMFAGDSGTGKTSAAGQIARRLNLDLYRIDLSAVINKYIGETEKNLRRLFDSCEDCGVVMFFDECDAVFGKRTEIKDSHDRYANIEVSYLLQRIESYRGLAILATNKVGAIDTAFLRRLRFVVTFQLPGAEQRREIWRRLLPEQGPLPTANLNYDWLASFDKLTGGAIHSASVRAAFLAAQRNRNAVTMEEARDAIKSEYTKLNLPLRATDLQIPPSKPKSEVPPIDGTNTHEQPITGSRNTRVLT